MLCINSIYYILHFFTRQAHSMHKNTKIPKLPLAYLLLYDNLGNPCVLFFLYYFKANKCISSVFAPCFPNIFLLIVDFRFVILCELWSVNTAISDGIN